MTVTVAPTDPGPAAGPLRRRASRVPGRERAGRPDDGTRGVHTALRRFVLAGGKRMRPLFCYWGWRGFGGPDGGRSWSPRRRWSCSTRSR